MGSELPTSVARKVGGRRTTLTQNHGVFFVRDLLGFAHKTLLGVWPDLIAADEAEVAVRLKLEELADHLARAAGTTETSVVYEL